MPSLDDPAPAAEPDAIEAFTSATILALLRQAASDLDPVNRKTFATMPASRWRDAAGLAAELLVTHWGFHLHRQRGRRRHTSEMYRLLAQTNEAQLAAG